MADFAGSSMYEVEMKFRVQQFEPIEQQLQQLKAVELQRVEEEDAYFNHPQRDFAQTDEAFRVRTSGDSVCITYKGPKLDRTTKTRQEIEVPLVGTKDLAEQLMQVFSALSFRPVGIVRKQRRRYRLHQETWDIEVTLDEVNEVGMYVELEIRTDASGMEPAKLQLHNLAKLLNLTEHERRSYLHLLLSRRSAD